eukprot:gene15290-18092_t
MGLGVRGQFYTVFPETLAGGLYITGESYAGHYVPGFAHYIHVHNTKARSASARRSLRSAAEDPLIIPLKGIAVGDGWVDPVEQMGGYPEMMYSLGLADDLQRAKIEEYCNATIQHIK